MEVFLIEMPVVTKTEHTEYGRECWSVEGVNPFWITQSELSKFHSCQQTVFHMKAGISSIFKLQKRNIP